MSMTLIESVLWLTGLTKKLDRMIFNSMFIHTE